MKRNQILRVALITAGAAAAVWLGSVLLLPVALPFLIALLLARIAQTPTRFLQERGRLPRILASGVTIVGLWTLLSISVYALCRVVCGELMRLARALPQALGSLAEPMGQLRFRLTALASRLPEYFREPVQEGISAFFENGSLVAEKGSAALFSMASSIVAWLPDFFLFLITTVLASFMLCSRYDTLMEFAARQIPARWKNRWQSVLSHLRATLWAWLQAQLKLTGITFALTAAGLVLLRVDFALLLAVLIAVVDALPVFGAGTILIPWSLFSFLQQDTRMGIGLALLYGAVWLTRSVLEPRMVGKEMGLHPLLTLAAIYAGYRFVGVAGMILFPVGAILIKQFWDHTVPKGLFSSQNGEQNQNFPPNTH